MCGVASNLYIEDVSTSEIHLQIFRATTTIKSEETDLVTKTLRGDDSDLITNTLVGFEVERQFGIVPFDDDLGRFLDRLYHASACSVCT